MNSLEQNTQYELGRARVCMEQSSQAGKFALLTGLATVVCAASASILNEGRIVTVGLSVATGLSCIFGTIERSALFNEGILHEAQAQTLTILNEQNQAQEQITQQ